MNTHVHLLNGVSSALPEVDDDMSSVPLMSAIVGCLSAAIARVLSRQCSRCNMSAARVLSQ